MQDRIIISIFCTLALFYTTFAFADEISDLKVEVKSVQQQITAAEAEDQKYSGGLVKSLIAVRIQVLKTTEALLQQKIVTVQTGSPITTRIQMVQTNLSRAEELEKEISSKKQEIDAQRKDAARYTGGLVLSMKLATIATGEQTIAMLEQQYLMAKYGLPFFPEQPKTPIAKDNSVERKVEFTEAESIILPTISNKRYEELKYQKYIYFDIDWKAATLEKSARSIKGVLLFCDLFGDIKFPITVTIDDAIEPGGILKQKGVGFEVNQFKDEHSWVRNTSLENMTIRFKITNILYQDGTRKDF